MDHQLNWWFAHTIEGFIAGVPVNGYRNLATHHLSRAAAMSRLSFLPCLFFIPVNGSMYSLILIWSCIWSSSNCFFIYSLITRSFRPTVYKLDRFSRNKYEMAIHRKHLKDNGVKILSAKENIPETPEGVLLESLLEGYEHSNGHNKKSNMD